MFNYKKCNQCKGIGYIIKNPGKDFSGKGSKVQTVEEIIPIPRGIKTETHIRLEKKVIRLFIKAQGNISELKDIEDGDLVIKVKVENNPLFKRSENDIEYNLDITLVDALFGNKLEVNTIDGEKVSIDITAGCQNSQKVIIKNKVFIIILGILSLG